MWSIRQHYVQTLTSLSYLVRIFESLAWFGKHDGVESTAVGSFESMQHLNASLQMGIPLIVLDGQPICPPRQDPRLSLSQPPSSSESSQIHVTPQIAQNTSLLPQQLVSSYHWAENHSIERTDSGTRKDSSGRSNRRTRGDCRHCPCRSPSGKRISRVTTYRCTECKIYLHPECFMAFHRERYNANR